MNCPKCGKANPEDAKVCESCNLTFQSILGVAKADVRVSRLAIASLVFGILSLAAIVALVLSSGGPRAIERPVPATAKEIIGVLCACAPVPATVLGIISLIQIELSGGRLSGRGFAQIGVAIPAVLYCWMVLRAALFRTRMVGYAFRMTCGTNLSLIGKAMLIYANDYDGKLPRAGGKDSVWAASISNWRGDDRFKSFNLQSDGSGGEASISASLYLLVKYGEVSPKTFICVTGEPKAKEFKPAECGVTDKELIDLIDLWDFGPEPQKHCSYSYHTPFSQFVLTTSGHPGMAIAADRNPWIDSPFAKAKDFARFKPDIAPWNGSSKDARWGNTPSHQGDGQNVLFLDSHVNFEKRAFCGIEDDNIYTYWDREDRIRGIPPRLGSEPASKGDSLLVHDPPVEPMKARHY